MVRATDRFALLALAAFIFAISFAAAQAPSAEQIFRVKSNVVPLDVTVIDKDGNPVLGLTAEDFEVFENGIPQVISYFSAPEPPRRSAEAPPWEGRVSNGPELRPGVSDFGDRAEAHHRRFLFLMGNIGDDHFKSIEDLAQFVERLEPRDEVALMAFRRVGEFTTDQDKTAAAVRRYVKVNNAVDSILTLRRKSDLLLIATPHAKRLPDSVRRKIKSFFEESGLRSRELPEPVFQNVKLDRLPTSSPLQSVQRMDALNAIAAAQFRGPESSRPEAMDLFVDGNAFALNAFDEARRKLLADFPEGEEPLWTDISDLDMSQLLTAIEYLSLLEGEKHLFFLNDRGLHATSEQLAQISRFAATNRVRLFLFQTGGTGPAISTEPRRGRLFQSPGSFSGTDVLNNTGYNRGLSPALALSALKTLARDTGGTASIHSHIREALDRALQMTNLKYEIAYSTADDDWSREFRTIEVRVRGDNLKAFHRRGYSGSPASDKSERRRNLVLLRTVAAMKQPEYAMEIPLSMKVSKRPSAGEGTLFEVRLLARMTGSSFHRSDGLEHGQLAVVYFLVQGKKVVSFQDQVDLALSEDDYQAAIKDGFNFVRHLELPKALSDGILKVVVYEAENDLLGSVDLALPES